MKLFNKEPSGYEELALELFECDNYPGPSHKLIAELKDVMADICDGQVWVSLHGDDPVPVYPLLRDYYGLDDFEQISDYALGLHYGYNSEQLYELISREIKPLVIKRMIDLRNAATCDKLPDYLEP